MTPFWLIGGSSGCLQLNYSQIHRFSPQLLSVPITNTVNHEVYILDQKIMACWHVSLLNDSLTWQGKSSCVLQVSWYERLCLLCILSSHCLCNDGLPSLQVDRFAIPQHFSTNLRPSGIHKHCCPTPSLLWHTFLKRCNSSRPSNLHARHSASVGSCLLPRACQALPLTSRQDQQCY